MSLVHSGTLVSGSNYTKESLVIVPASWRSGLYTVKVITDIYQRVFESHITNNNIKSSSITVIQKLADLAVKRLNVIVTADQTSGCIMFNITNITVANEGDAQIANQVWTDSIYIDFMNKKKLNLANTRIKKTVTTGQHYIHNVYADIVRQKYSSAQLVVFVDSSRVIFEKNENNNQYITAIFSLPQMFDKIEISNLKLMNLLSKTVLKKFFSGSEILVQVLYKNKQAFPTVTGWIDELLLEISDKRYYLKQFFVPVMEGNKTFNREVSVLLPQNIFGNATLVLRHDVNKKLIKSTALSYTMRKEFYLQQPPSPDLKPRSITYVSILDFVKSIRVSWSVENVGNHMQKVLTWKDVIILSKSQLDPYSSEWILLGSYPIIAKLQSEQIYTQSKDITIPNKAAGDYYLHIVTDSINEVLELNGETNNNLKSKKVYTVPILPLPDLFVKLDYIQKVVVHGGDHAKLRYTVQNNGASASVSSWTDHIFMQKSNEDNIFQLISLQHIGAVERNSSYSKEALITYPLYLTKGQYVIKLVTDKNNKVVESNEDNNVVLKNIEYIPALKIDFKIASNTTNLTIVAGQPVSLSYNVTNIGKGPQLNTFSWFDAIYLSENLLLDSFDIKVAVLIQNWYLSVNSSYSGLFNFKLPFDMPNRNYYLILKTDSSRMLQDSNIKNNIITIQLKNIATSFSSDLAVINIKAPSSITYGKSLAGSWDIINNGTKQVSGYKCDSFYISIDEKWNLKDTELITQCGFVNLNGKAKTTNKKMFSMSKAVPLVKQDKYYSIVKSRSNIKDFDLRNNVAASKQKTLVTHKNLTLGVEELILVKNIKNGIRRIPGINAGESLLVSVTCSNCLVSNELFVRFNEPASMESFDVFAGEFISPDQIAVVANTRKGEYYVYLRTSLLHLSASNAQLKLLAKMAKFEINNVYPRKSPPLAAHTTYKIDGSLFPSDYKVQFVNSKSSEIVEPISTYRFSSTLIYATVNMTPFDYSDVVDVEIVHNVSGKRAVFKKAVTIIVGQIGSIVTRINSPDGLRVGDEGDLSIDVQNVGGTDVLVPMFYLDVGGNVTLKIPNENKTIGTNNLLFMASSNEGPAGIIAPGKTSHIDLKVIQNVRNVASMPVSINILNQNGEKEHPYTKAKDAFRPVMLENQQWDPVWEIFLKHVGTTRNRFYQRLSKTLNNLSLLDDRIISVDELVKFELDLANGFHTGTDIYRVADLQTNSTSFPYIKVARYFNPKITFRDVPGPFNGHGPFGKGWISPLW